MHSQLEKAIKLAKKTGDRLIVVDGENYNNVFVVMSLDQYDQLLAKNSQVRGLTESELLDKINRDIAVWKNDQDIALDNTDCDFEKGKNDDIWRWDDDESDYDNHDFMPAEDSDWSDDENLYYYNEEDEETSDYLGDFSSPVPPDSVQSFKDIVENNKEKFEKFSYDFPEEENTKKSVWKIPPSIKKQAEEIIED